MAVPVPLQQEYLGMVQDNPRDLPSMSSIWASSLWNVVDFIPVYLGAPLRKRGGWSYASPTLGSTTYIDALIYAPFAGGAKNLGVGSDGHLYQFTSGSSSNVGTAFAVAQNPVYHRTGTTGLVVIPAGSGTNIPKSYDGTTFQNLAGTPPAGIYADVWNDRTLLANGTAGGTLYPQRLWASPIGDAAGSWDLTNSWVDFSLPLTAIAVLKTTILGFHLRSTERIKGTIFPSSTSIGDLTMDAAFNVGCIDARSIAKYNDTVIWADTLGIYQSDGAALKNLTAAGGMAAYWTSLLANYTANYHIAAGIYHDTYLVSVLNGSTFVDCLAYDLLRGYWYRLSNFNARCFARISSTIEETYMGLGNAGRVASLSSILTPTAATKNDGDGTAVTPYFETPLYRGWQRLHRRWIPSYAIQSWSRVYLNYDIEDAATDNPQLTVSWSIDPADTSYTNLPVFVATTKFTRGRRDLQFQGSGLMLKVAQQNASADTRIHAIESEYDPLEPSRLIQ